jgi:pyridinium-3,5-biscarboxylic acid mononucleotide synthase
MDKERIAQILNSVSTGEVSPEQAMELLKNLPYEELGFARIDLHRSIRQGMPEVIFCPGKTVEQIVEIALRLKAHHKLVLASRLEPDVAAKVLPKLKASTTEGSIAENSTSAGAFYNELGKMLIVGALPQPDETLPSVAVVTAGTADLPVAEEAAIVLQSAGVPVNRITDVGVAGIHRLLGSLDQLQKSTVTIVVAGMDGALPSVVAGLLASPVVAVPTSVGYGASFQGLAALLTMLNSCAAGLTVVNIDNGFGAANAALKIVNAIVAAKTSVRS